MYKKLCDSSLNNIFMRKDRSSTESSDRNQLQYAERRSIQNKVHQTRHVNLPAASADIINKVRSVAIIIE